MSSVTHLGLRLHEDLSSLDIEGRYFRGRTDYYRATEHAHIAPFLSLLYAELELGFIYRFFIYRIAALSVHNGPVG